MIKLITIDLDGSLLTDTKELPPDFGILQIHYLKIISLSLLPAALHFITYPLFLKELKTKFILYVTMATMLCIPMKNC